jgi:hypothetical protein
MNFRVQIIFNFNSVLKNLRKNDKLKKMFILTSPIGGYSILHYKPGKMVFTGEWRI